MTSQVSETASSVGDYLSSEEQTTMSSSSSRSNEEMDNNLCNKQLICGPSHTCMRVKNHPGSCGLGKCPYVRMYERECGHKTVQKCSYGFIFNLPPCDKICGKMQSCSHRCKRPCYACDGKCPPLMCDSCQWKVYCLDQEFSEHSDQASSVEDETLTDSSTENDEKISRGYASEVGSEQTLSVANSESNSEDRVATNYESESEHMMASDSGSGSGLEHMGAVSGSGSEHMTTDSGSGSELIDAESEAELEHTIEGDSEYDDITGSADSDNNSSRKVVITSDDETFITE